MIHTSSKNNNLCIFYFVQVIRLLDSLILLQISKSLIYWFRASSPRTTLEILVVTVPATELESLS